MKHRQGKEQPCAFLSRQGKIFLVEPEFIKFWVSQTHWSYAHIIFPPGFTSQGVSIRMLL